MELEGKISFPVLSCGFLCFVVVHLWIFVVHFVELDNLCSVFTWVSFHILCSITGMSNLTGNATNLLIKHVNLVAILILIDCTSLHSHLRNYFSESPPCLLNTIPPLRMKILKLSILPTVQIKVQFRCCPHMTFSQFYLLTPTRSVKFVSILTRSNVDFTLLMSFRVYLPRLNVE